MHGRIEVSQLRIPISSKKGRATKKAWCAREEFKREGCKNKEGTTKAESELRMPVYRYLTNCQCKQTYATIKYPSVLKHKLRLCSLRDHLREKRSAFKITCEKRIFRWEHKTTRCSQWRIYSWIQDLFLIIPYTIEKANGLIYFLLVALDVYLLIFELVALFFQKRRHQYIFVNVKWIWEVLTLNTQAVRLTSPLVWPVQEIHSGKGIVKRVLSKNVPEISILFM